jgi:hypothetical protein
MSVCSSISAVFRIACAAPFVLGAIVISPARAESGEPGTSYASLPSDPEGTGSLPGAATPLITTATMFSAAVDHGGVLLRATTPTGCLPGNLKSVVADLSAKFGPVSLESTHRSRGRNFRAGGARHSLHLSCRAIDFRVRRHGRGVMAYLRGRPEVGGLKVYRNGIIHIDDGERRTW